MAGTWMMLAATLLLILGGSETADAQPANHPQPGRTPGLDTQLAASGDPDDRNRESDYRILATIRVSTMERELNEAAAEGFRLELVGDDIDSGEGLVDELFALLLGDSRPDRFSYRLVTLKDLTTMEEELAQALTSAAADGFRYRGLVQAPLGGYAVVVLEQDADAEADPIEYLVLATARLSTLERELEEAASLGYRVMALTMNGGSAFDSNDKIALLARPHSADAPAGP